MCVVSVKENIASYTGHCPEYKYRIGDTYGSTTHKILLDPSVSHSERLVLSDRTADDFQIFRPPRTDIDVVNARFRNGDPVYKHPMIPGYEGKCYKVDCFTSRV
ncbi:jg7420 [Pararge aegeria aegeria]|uniref:Jg7420 protein n=1 Tax=Pararge aegeria aegeria TaxID=348720 RepID=A0A8S4QMZ5_9NEOP|nr:jg7420 [Pararge aegeria aegeria]